MDEITNNTIQVPAPPLQLHLQQEQQPPKKLRKTQRVPKACVYCTKKKIKCDKKLPCQTCISKNIANQCVREPVIVNNRVYNLELASPKTKGSFNEVDSLRLENENLKKQIEELNYKLRQRPSAIPIMSTEDQYTSEIKLITRNLGGGNSKIDFMKGIDLNMDLDELSWYSNKLKCLYVLKSNMINRVNLNKVCKFALENFGFIHCGVIPGVFMQQLQNVDIEKLKGYETLDLTKIDEILFYAMIFAVLSGGFYFASESLLLSIGISTNNLTSIAKLFFILSLKYLSKLRYMELPNIKTIQVFMILNINYHNFSGVHLQNFLHNGMIYTARTLDIDKLSDENLKKEMATNENALIEYETGRRLWFVLLLMDRLEIYGGRIPLVPDGSFSTCMPQNFADDDLINFKNSAQVKNEHYMCEITYQFYVSKIIDIRNEFYQSEPYNFNLMNQKFENLAIHLNETYSNTPKSEHVEYLNFLAKDFILLEQLNLNKLLNLKLSKREWAKNYRLKCLIISYELIDLMLTTIIPIYKKKNWAVSYSLVLPSVFILLDKVTNKVELPSTLLTKFDEVLALLNELSNNSIPAKRGYLVIKNLLNLNNAKDKAYEEDFHQFNFSNYLMNDDEFNDFINWFKH